MTATCLSLLRSAAFPGTLFLSGVALAQDAPLTITHTATFGLGHFAPHLSLDGDQFAARESASGLGTTTGVHVFVRSGSTWSEQANLPAPVNGVFSVPGEHDISLRGTRLVVGCGVPLEGGGEFLVSEFSGGSWGSFTIVPNPEDFDNFGSSVLQRENLIIAGNPDQSMGLGFAFVFRLRNGIWHAGPWHVGGTGEASWGRMLADSGNTLIGTGGHETQVLLRGAHAGIWIQQAELTPLAGAAIASEAIDGDLLATGLWVSGSNSAARVFQRTGSTWSAPQVLVPPVAGGIGFGTAIAVRGPRVFVGAPLDGIGTGVVHVYQQLAGVWTRTARLVAPAPVAGGHFGMTLAVDGNTLLVGADASPALGAGSVYVFDLTDEPAPLVYCTAKQNSIGCLPAIAASGLAGLSSPQPFHVQAAHVLNHRIGLLLYSTSGPANTPFLGGALCLAQPLHRTAIQHSGGTTGIDDCSGTYDFDFNAYAASGADPALQPGVAVWAQYYSRDPGDPFGVGLTDALSFTLGS